MGVSRYLDKLCVYIEDSERGIGEKSGDRVSWWRLQFGRVCVCREKKKKGGCLFLKSRKEKKRKEKKIYLILILPPVPLDIPLLFLSFYRRVVASPLEVHEPIQLWEGAWNC